jgi:hypothetical protein
MGATLTKQNMPKQVGIGGLVRIMFPIVTLSTSQTSATVQSSTALDTAFKIYRVTALLTATVAGTCSINIVAGTAAEAGTTPTPDAVDYAIAGTFGPPAYPTAGQQVFLTDQALTMTSGVATVLTPPTAPVSGSPGNGWDCIWGPSGLVLTLRTVTSSGASGTLAVSMLGKFYDPKPYNPNANPFNPATDLV